WLGNHRPWACRSWHSPHIQQNKKSSASQGREDSRGTTLIGKRHENVSRQRPRLSEPKATLHVLTVVTVSTSRTRSSDSQATFGDSQLRAAYTRRPLFAISANRLL